MKIQNFSKIKQQNRYQVKEITNIQSRKDNNVTQQNDQRNRTPLPIIKINGKLKNNIQSFSTPNSNRQRFDKIDLQEVEIGDNDSQLPTYRSKSRPITKKKINFSLNPSNINKQSTHLDRMFIHTLTNLSCDRRFVQKLQQVDPAKKNFPSEIVNIFYGQNFHNYNPYIQTLDRLYDSFRGRISRQMMQRIKKLCYIGLARSYLKAQRYSYTPNYRRVNILIRTYMYQNMRNIIEQKDINYQNVVFIPCNKDAMSFSHRKFPQQLTSICSHQRFQTTIENVNRIIQNHYLDYKQMNRKQTVSDRWGENLCYLLTVLFLVIFIISDNEVFVYILGFFVVLTIGLYLYQARLTLGMLGSSKNIIQKIQDDIQNYLKNINTHNIQWKVGVDFYWLEIHYIKRVKKKPIRYRN